MLEYRFLTKPRHLCMIPIACFLMFSLSYDGTAAQSTRTPTATVTRTPIATKTPDGAVSDRPPVPRLLFSTPRPVREEPALSSGFHNVPSVFLEGDDYLEESDYHTVQADRSLIKTGLSIVTSPREVIKSVVQILRCDQFGCNTPVGTGVIVHPSGLILTAYHVLLENPDDLRSSEYEEFVIALTENVRTPPRPLYHAFVVADKNEQDIALLAIDRNLDEEAIDPNHLNLPALPFADVEMLFADTLHILGFPVDGGDAVSYFPATFTSFDDDGQLSWSISL
ncbi:serine protease [Chloroflexi bacterium TSY]|nr:serine protease [Chloroflexi bacterium TSY]